MTKVITRHNIGQAGEYLVASELARRGFTVALPTGNAESIDILVYGYGRSFAVQVKSVSGGVHQFNLGKFIDVVFEDDGRQSVKGARKDLDRNIYLVLVYIGEKPGNDEFLCTTAGDLADYLAKAHKSYLDNYGGRRPGSNPKSLHCAIKKEHFKEGLRHVSLEKALENWTSMDPTTNLPTGPN